VPFRGVGGRSLEDRAAFAGTGSEGSFSILSIDAPFGGYLPAADSTRVNRLLRERISNEIREHFEQRFPTRRLTQLGQRSFVDQASLVEQPEAITQALSFV
jgi:hypothetical protein